MEEALPTPPSTRIRPKLFWGFGLLLFVASLISIPFLVRVGSTSEPDYSFPTRQEILTDFWKEQTVSKAHPRWKPFFSCESYDPTKVVEPLFDTDEFSNRVAGTHSSILHSDAFGGVLVKPESSKSCEITFFEQLYDLAEYPFQNEYERIELSPENQQVMHALRKEFIPEYHGVFHASQHSDRWYCIMNDVTVGYENPSMADITIQPRQYGPTKTFVIKGLITRLADNTSLKVEFNDMRNAWSHMTDEDVLACLASFFYDGTQFRHDVAASLLPQIERVVELIKSQNYFLFVDTSLLLIYEGDQVRLAEKGTNPTVHLIDFDEAVPFWSDIKQQESEHFKEQEDALDFLEASIRNISTSKHWDSLFSSPQAAVASCPSMYHSSH